MKKTRLAALLTLPFALALGGCGWMDRIEAKYTGYAKTCIDGVTYIQFTSGAAAQVDLFGKPIPCKK